MTRQRFARSTLLVLALGCSADDDGANAPDTGTDDPSIGGQTGEETLGCLAVERDALAWSERSALGFSADELLGALGSERQATLTYADGTTTRLQLQLTRAEGDLSFEQREWVDGNTGIETAAAPSCNDVVSVPATLAVITTDGAFAEQLPLRLLAESGTLANAFASLDLAELAGSYTPADASTYGQVLINFTLVFDGDDWSGTIAGQGNSASAGSPDGVASSRNLEIGSF